MALSTVSGILTRNGDGTAGDGLGSSGRSGTSAHGQGSSSTSTSTSSAGSRAAPANAWRNGLSPLHPYAHRPGGQTTQRQTGKSSSTSPSTPTAAWPTPRSSLTKRPPPRPASSAARSPSTPATASRSSSSSPTTAPAYISTVHAIACRQLKITRLRTRPRRPQTNGKAERFIRTMLTSCAYGAIYALKQRTNQRP